MLLSLIKKVGIFRPYYVDICIREKIGLYKDMNKDLKILSD